MMTFLLFPPASTKWLAWHKDRKSPRDCLGRFVTFVVQSYFDILLHYVLSVTFCGAELSFDLSIKMSGEINSAIVWYEMLWRTIVLFPIFYLNQDLMKIFLVYGWDPAHFHIDYVAWLQHLSSFAYKNLVVTSPFWVWGPIGHASMQLPVFSWIGILNDYPRILIL